jgi:hypothetical protein
VGLISADRLATDLQAIIDVELLRELNLRDTPASRAELDEFIREYLREQAAQATIISRE